VDNLSNSSICFGKIVVFFETPIFDSVSAHKTCASSTVAISCPRCRLIKARILLWNLPKCSHF
jgi:hypothetical protein